MGIVDAILKLLNLLFGIKLYDEYKKGNKEKFYKIHLLIIVFCIVLIFGSLFVFGILEYL